MPCVQQVLLALEEESKRKAMVVKKKYNGPSIKQRSRMVDGREMVRWCPVGDNGAGGRAVMLAVGCSLRRTLGHGRLVAAYVHTRQPAPALVAGSRQRSMVGVQRAAPQRLPGFDGGCMRLRRLCGGRWHYLHDTDSEGLPSGDRCRPNLG